MQNTKRPRWGKHMSDPKVRETLFELSKQLNPPKKKNWKGNKPARKEK